MAKRGRRKLIWLAVVVVALAGLLVVGDRVAAGVAEDRVAAMIADRAADYGVQSARPPDVDFAGFPFVTQVIGGRYDRIDIHLVDLSTGDLTLPRFEIHAFEVTAAVSDVLGGNGPIVAGRLQADGHISYDTLTTVLSDATSAKVSRTPDGLLQVAATVEVMGHQIPVIGTANVTFDGTVLRVVGENFIADGVDLPPGGQEVLDLMAQSFSREIPVPALPYGLVLEDLRLEADSRVLSASAQDVPLA